MKEFLRENAVLEPVVRLYRRVKWERRVQRLRQAKRELYPETRRSELPIVFGNAMAKAGSHILSQFLEGISATSPLVYTDLHPIRTITQQGRRRSPDEVLHDLDRLETGDIAWGYLPGAKPYIQALVKPEVVNFFVYRDPRDKIISTIKYAMDIHEGHAMRAYFHELETMEERIEAVITGVPGYVSDIRTSYESYLPWFEQSSVQCISFEELVNQRSNSLELMVHHLESSGVRFSLEHPELFSTLNLSMSPERSPTFRSGKSGGWRDYFTERNKEAFKRTAGDLLIRMGYESSEDW